MRINCTLNLRRRLDNKQSGFSMLEVLVTILVVSFGLLGMAALITTGMRSNNTAHFRSIATQQTLDIADRMRANLAGVRAGNYDALTAVIPVSDDCVAANCTTAQMSVYDHAQWNTANSALLPGGRGTVTGTLATGYLITLIWIEKEMGGATDSACPGTPANTRCFLTRFSP
ncbi:MAG: type IV pilus assembly protein PilV [Candidatus Nitrotoga sp. MKT]|nr:MAG: type IV pilus assembly protein PilV [Candidatus Nitrotoga sp. MKT]